MKKILTYTAFILAFVITMSSLDRLLSKKSIHGINQAKSFYAQPKDSIDVLMLGSSHIHCDVNTALLWEKYGIAAFDFSAAEQTLWQTYYYFKEALKTQQPKVAVLDFYAPANFKNDYQYDFLYENLQGLKPSFNKLALFANSCEVMRWDDYFPDFFTYHNRYEDLGEEDFDALFGREDLITFKGYTPYCAVKAQPVPDFNVTLAADLTPKSEKYLQKIIDFANDNNVKLFFIVAPYAAENKEMLSYNRVADIAASNGIEFINMNYEYDAIGLDFETDFNDHSHLNYEGSCKFTDYLASELFGRFGGDMIDRRGDERYKSWDDSVALTEKMRLEAKEKEEEKLLKEKEEKKNKKKK
ncbi:hypothetical protein [Butyrivibrio sp. AE3004]|uniref:hypothetical protein n=1 Tax=Butyrivibrio sp. AE3004 TaxID=1506994 RepID=UPI000493C066|nr:hypothetical protein [Butyrivibrio sp. AE3004]